MSKPYTIGKRRGEHELIYRDAQGARHRHTLATPNQRQAELIAPALYAELTRPKGTTVAELWGAYNHDKAGRVTVTNRVTSWKAVKERFGSMDAERITIDDCRAHIAERRTKGIKDGSIYTELTQLRVTLTWAKKHKLVSEAAYIERPSQPAPKDDYLTKDQCRALIASASLPHIKLYITLALGTGARNGALLGLTWERCDFKRDRIDLRNPVLDYPRKGRAVVPMNRMVKAALLGAHGCAKTEFVIEWKGEPVKSVKKSLKSAASKAQIAHVSPHLFRHSAAVHMAEADVPMERVAQFLGHADINVTRRIYARFSPSHLRDAAEALEL
jgi:integrase